MDLLQNILRSTKKRDLEEDVKRKALASTKEEYWGNEGKQLDKSLNQLQQGHAALMLG